MSCTVFTKPYGTGKSCKGLIIPAGQIYSRKTILPADWKRARIALLMSITNGTENNGTPSAETVIYSDEATHMHIGFSNVKGRIGAPGLKFVGVSNYPTNPACIGNSYSEYALGYSSSALTNSTSPFISNAGVFLKTQNYVGLPSSCKPSATTEFCFGTAIDLELRAGGALTARMAGESKLSDSSQFALNRVMSALQVTAADHAGGWWSDSVPVDCPYLYLHFPFLNNRIILYGMQVQQLG